MITGGIEPVQKESGDRVMCGSIVREGAFNMKVDGANEKSAIMKVVHLIMASYTRKAKFEKPFDRLGGWVPYIAIMLSIMVFIVWVAVGYGLEFAFISALAVMIVASPAMFGISVSTAVMAGSAKAAEYGILLKGTDVIQAFRKSDTLVVSKSGIFTEGKPELTDVIVFGKHRKNEVIRLVASVGSGLDHPISHEMVHYADVEGMKLYKASAVKYEAGMGVQAKVSGKTIHVGSMRYMSKMKIDLGKMKDDISAKVSEYQMKGFTAVFIAVSKRPAAVLVFADRIRPYAREVIAELSRMGKDIIMVSGDSDVTCDALACYLGITDVASGMLLKDRGRLVSDLVASGRRVAYLSHGKTGKCAMKDVSVNVVIGSTDVSGDAGIIMMKSDPSDILTAMRLCTKTMKKVRQNVNASLIYNVVGLALAAGGLAMIAGVQLHPVIAGILLGFSPVFVILNSLSIYSFRQKSLRSKGR
jgi:Cu+-exporting ATPase